MRKTFLAALRVCACVSLLSYPFASAQSTSTNSGTDPRILRGQQISPVTLNLSGKDTNAVYLGSYLVNAVGGCNDCHSCPSYIGTNPYTVGGKALGATNTPGPTNSVNYLAGGVPFGPAITSYNLTPDTNGNPGGMTLAQFAAAIVNGVDSHDGGILQIMPWPTYRHMNAFDFAAVYAYLSAIPSAQPGPCTGSGQTGQ